MSSLAAGESGPGVKRELDDTRFHSALLTVFLHELEHLVFPARPESSVRRRSDDFYVNVLDGVLSERFGLSYGIYGI